MKHTGIHVKGVRLSKDGNLTRDLKGLDVATRLKQGHSTKVRPRRGQS
jgi:hypothetical protein